MAKKVTIGTHDGGFHCDEALACWMLRLLPEYKTAVVVRTRKPDKLNECDIVVDVGAVFDHSRRRYDHHQREFTDSFNSLDKKKKWQTKLSSAGLTYVFYGRKIVKQLISDLMEEQEGSSNPAEDEEQLELIYDQVYENFIEEIDAVDNGIAVTEGLPRYLITTTISKRVANLIPAWNEQSDDNILYSQFEKAMELVGSEMKEKVKYYAFTWLSGFDIVRKSVLNRHTIHSSGEIIVLENGAVPWKDHIYTIEEELGITKPIKYVLYADNTEHWRVQCVPVRSGSFKSRLQLPEPWCGVRDDQLSKLSGIDGCIFVHSNGFIGGNSLYEGALEMASKSLRMNSGD